MSFAISSAGPQAASGVATPAALLQHRKLADAAQQFEGMLLQEMLKPMKEHGFAQEDGDDDNDKDAGSGFADTLSSYGSETLAASIAKSGGLGIAKHVVLQIEGEKTAHAVSASPET